MQCLVCWQRLQITRNKVIEGMQMQKRGRRQLCYVVEECAAIVLAPTRQDNDHYP